MALTTTECFLSATGSHPSVDRDRLSRMSCADQFAYPASRVIILRENDTAEINPSLLVEVVKYRAPFRVFLLCRGKDLQNPLQMYRFDVDSGGVAGQSQQAIFELRQAMGGGKTHNMIALGLLARFPELKNELPDSITAGMADEPAVIATVNGRDVQKFIWGDIAEQLGQAEAFRDHWANGPMEMSEGDWIRLIGDRPTLIMLDELPPYFAMAHTKTIGQGTLLDLLKYSIANLFSAAMKLKRCVVVVASLDAAYDEARRILGGQLADLQKETSRGAKSITPVDLNTGEIYDILRKRLLGNAVAVDHDHGPGADRCPSFR